MLAASLGALDALAGRTVYSACACGVTVLVGVAVGLILAAAVWRWRPAPAAALGALFLLMGCWAVVQQGLSAGVAEGWRRILGDLGRTFPQYLVALAKTAAIFCLPQAVLAGVAVYAALPATGKRDSGTLWQVFTLVFLLGLVPAVSGWGLAGSLLIPAAGVEGVLRLAVWWFGILAVLAIGRRRGWGLLAAALLLAGALAAGRSGRQSRLLHENIFSRLVYRDSGFACGEPVFARRSRHHAIAAYEDRDYQFVFTLDGRPLLFGNRFHTARVLTGYIPLLLCPGADKVAYFGPEAGLYMPFAVRAGAGSVVCAGADRDAVKAMLAAEELVGGGEEGLAGLRWPRARLGVKARYDVIFLANEPAWMRGTRRAYSRGLFEKCRKALRSGGITALHLDARLLTERRFAAVAEDFADAFPHVQVWSAGVYDWLLVGCGQPFRVAADKALGVFERKAVTRDCARAGVSALPDVLAGFVCGGPALKSWVAQAGKVSHCRHAWQAPRAAFGGVPVAGPEFLNAARAPDFRWLVPEGMDEDVYVAVRARAEECARARGRAASALALLAGGASDEGMAALRAAAAASPREALLTHFAETLELEGRRRIAIGEFNGALRCYENILSFTPGTARSHYGMGYCLRARGETDAAYLHFARAVAFAPEQTGYRLELAQVAVTVGEYREADRQYREIMAREPDNAEAMFLAAKTLMAKERDDKDVPSALKLAERACEITGWDNRELAQGLADLYLEAGRVMEGVGLKRLLKEGGKPRLESDARP